MTNLVDAVIEAHGGLARWRATPFVQLRLSSGGLAFALKGQGRALERIDARVATQGQDVHLIAAGRRARLSDGVFTLEGPDASIVETKADAGSFRGPRRLLRWSHADVLRFASLAIWTYASVPFVLARDDVETEVLDPWSEQPSESWHRVAVRFPDHLHTHSAQQVLYFDEQLRLRRHDYTAEAFGRWAKASHYCTSHRSFSGLLVPTRRRVYPRKRNNHPRGWPLLVRIDVERAATTSADVD